MNRKQMVGLALVAHLGWVGSVDVQATTVAYGRFETDNGTAVTNGQTITRVDDSSGDGWNLFPFAPATPGIVSPGRYATNSVPIFSNPVPGSGLPNNFYSGVPDSAFSNATFSGLVDHSRPPEQEIPAELPFTHLGVNNIFSENGAMA